MVEITESVNNREYGTEDPEEGYSGGVFGILNVVCITENTREHGHYLSSLLQHDHKMLSIVRKCLVIAAVDGLILQSLPRRNQRSAQIVQISYGTYEITSKNAKQSEQSDGAEALEVYGIVGRLSFQ